MELLCAACGVPTPTAREVAELYRENEMVPLCNLIQQISSWETALKALTMLNKEDRPAGKAAATARLIWVLSDDGDYYDIQPREQKQNKSGKWSAGRNVALRRLKEEMGSLDFLLPQDVKICGCIRQEREYGGYYGRELYRLDQNSAFPLMVGHPHVFLDDAGTVRLEVVKGEPELLVTRNGNDLRMSLNPPLEPDQKLMLVKDTPTRLRVTEVTEEHRRIAAILGDGLNIPAKAKDRALEAIASVSSFLTVHSDIGGGGEKLETVPSDATPCIHLLPFGDGLKVAMLVRPFSTGGPYFRPGAGGETVIAELNGIRVQTSRDLQGEAGRASRAAASLPVLEEAEGNSGEWLVGEPEQCLDLLLQLQALGDTVKVEWPQGEKFRVRHQASLSQFKAAIRQSKDWFELEGELQLDENLTLDMQRLLALLDGGGSRFVPLGDGEFLALSAEFRKRLEEVRAFTDPHGKGVRFHPLAAIALEDFTSEVGELKADKKWKEQVARLRTAQELRPVPPTTLQADLRDYQAEGFSWLNRLSHWGVGACLADDMGLGKTVQALAQILTMASQGPSLVVAPTSVCMNWESEAGRFAPTLNVIIFGGSARKKTLEELCPFDLVVCSYGLMQQEAELLAAVSWQTIVLDEAQAIKNMATKRSQAAMELNGAFKMLTTGTPIENHLGELWNIFRFINPGLLGSLKQFNRKFAIPIERDQDKKARARLKKLIHPFILRRTKNQVLEELPPRTEILLHIEMSTEEAALYEALRRKAVEKLASVQGNEGQKHLQILAEIMRLRRACCNARLVAPESGVSSSKLAAFAGIVDELRENRHKALVFSQFVDHLAIIREYLDERGIVYQYLDGSTAPQERKRRVEAFQSGEGELFLISLKAGGVGLNLTAADYVIHMDPWWNPAVEDQASDRAHRIGQQRPVTIYRLVIRGTIEEKIVALHHDKRGLADSLLEGSDMSGKVSAEELLNLLRQEV